MKPKLVVDLKVSIIAVILLVALFVPMSYVHEFGHLIVCASEGYTYDLYADALGGELNCHGTPSNLLFYYAFGGMFAMLVSLAPFVHWRWIRRHRAVIIVALSFAIAHGFNALIETSYHDLYVQHIDIARLILSTFSAIIFIILLLTVGRKIT